jgi:hypothetical protein
MNIPATCFSAACQEHGLCNIVLQATSIHAVVTAAQTLTAPNGFDSASGREGHLWWEGDEGTHGYLNTLL